MALFPKYGDKYSFEIQNWQTLPRSPPINMPDKKHNFGAGPGILPESVLNRAAEAVKHWDASGLSVLEVSHRSAEFEHVVKETEKLARELLDIPDTYSVLFLQGGASMQFAMVPMNFLQKGQKAAYLDAGHFGQKAIKEAGISGE